MLLRVHANMPVRSKLRGRRPRALVLLDCDQLRVDRNGEVELDRNGEVVAAVEEEIMGVEVGDGTVEMTATVEGEEIMGAKEMYGLYVFVSSQNVSERVVLQSSFICHQNEFQKAH